MKIVQMPETPHLRQLDFYNPDHHDPKITLIGAGGIGSWVALLLSKLGVKHLNVYDNDRVVLHNVGTTPYTKKDVGKYKVEALKGIVKHSEMKFIGVPRRFTGKKLPKTDILISAVDSMDARRLLFKFAIKQRIPFYIDGRIGAQNLRVYAINIKNIQDRRYYRSTLVPNNRIAPLPCTGQQVIDVGLATASLIVRAVRQWVAEGIYTPEVIVKQDILQYVVSDHQYDPKRWEHNPFDVIYE